LWPPCRLKDLGFRLPCLLLELYTAAAHRRVWMVTLALRSPRPVSLRLRPNDALYTFP